MKRFLLQMAGGNGSGKSTLARAVGASTGAVVLDHDTTKSAVMAGGVPHPPAGAVSYEVVFELVRDLLAQGHSVIIDSPSVYSAVPDRGMELATSSGVPYYFVECECPTDVAYRRVNARVARLSQVKDAAETVEVMASPTRSPHRPARGVLQVDTQRTISECVESVVSYLATEGASGPTVRAARP